MRNLGFDGEPSAEVLDRLSKAKEYSMWGDIKVMKEYLRMRLREEKVSLYRLCDVTGWSRTTMSNVFNMDYSISFERLEAILWVVDGGTERWNEYRKSHE